MDGQYSWKRTEDIEIDLMDLLHRFLGQWKQILVCALVFAVAGAGFGYVKNRSSTGVSEAVTAEETELTETELQNVKDAAALEAEIRGLEEYLDSSVLMQLDPYHKSRYVMLYSIGHAQRQEIAAITESYFNFLLNGGAADALIKNGSAAGILEESSAASDAEKENSSRDAGAGKSCLAELIGVYQKT